MNSNGKRKRKLTRFSGAVLGVIAAIAAVLANVGFARAAIPVYAQPALHHVRTIHTNPFPGTSVRPNDAEGLAYVPQDGSIWLADDDSYQLLEIDVASGALKRVIPQSALAAAPRLGGTEVAGTNTASDFEALAYDASNDVLYLFAGKCCTSSIRAAAFRLLRDGSGAFQVNSFQPFTAPMNDFSGVGILGGQLWAGIGKVVYPYNYVSNSFGTGVTLSGASGQITGLGFSPDGKDLWVTNNKDELYRVDWATKKFVPNHLFPMEPMGIRDSRAVELVGDQLFICDGYDAYASNSPDRYAIKVYEVVDANGGPSAPIAAFTATPTSGVAPLQVSFTDASTGGVTSWSWNFGDGQTSSAQNPSHTFAAPGTYTVRLTVGNGSGNSTTTQTITATAAPTAPTAAFAATPMSGPAPLAVTFTDQSTGGATSWSWNFGDGGTSTERHPQHTFTSPGTYTVTLTASNTVGSSQTSHTITASGGSGGSGTVTLTSTKDATVYSSSPNKNYADYDYIRALLGAGEYRPYVGFEVTGLTAPPAQAVLRLFVTDASDKGGIWYRVSSAWTETGLTWNTAPPLTGSVIADIGQVVEGSWVEIDVTSVVTGNGSYSFGARTTSGNSLRYGSKESTSPPQLVLTLGGGSAPPTAPVAGFTASPTSGTAPLPVQFNDTSSGTPTSWSWNFGDGATSNVQSPSHTFSAPGTYTVSLTASNASGSSSASQTVTVTEAGTPPAPSTFTAVKDSFVNTEKPTKNYGDYDYIRGLASPVEYRSFVGFEVTGLSQAPTRAVLRLFVTDGSDVGGTWRSVTSAWSETTITWNNAPAPTGPVVANVGPVSSGSWIEIDVTSAITGNGSYSFVMTTPSTNSVRFGSRESGTPPQLVFT